MPAMEAKQAAKVVRKHLPGLFADEARDARFEEVRFKRCSGEWRFTISVVGPWGLDGWVAPVLPLTGRSYTLIRIDDGSGQVLSVEERQLAVAG